MKIIIAGSRDFNDYKLLNETCTKLFRNLKEIEIVSGCAKGADRLGEQFAIEHHYDLTKFPANWKYLGKKAGMERNIEMANYSDILVAFWDGKSKGTENMINLAKRKRLKIKVIYI